MFRECKKHKVAHKNGNDQGTRTDNLEIPIDPGNLGVEFSIYVFHEFMKMKERTGLEGPELWAEWACCLAGAAAVAWKNTKAQPETADVRSHTTENFASAWDSYMGHLLRVDRA